MPMHACLAPFQFSIPYIFNLFWILHCVYFLSILEDTPRSKLTHENECRCTRVSHHSNSQFHIPYIFNLFWILHCVYFLSILEDTPRSKLTHENEYRCTHVSHHSNSQNRVAKTHRIPYLCRSFSAKVTHI